MRFDVFYELAVPRFAGRDERTVYHETLAELSVAEACGIETAWLVEHHFMREYSHASAPDLFLAAAAQRTQRLRLGHAIVPLPYHHPLHVAERLATLDVLSNGRVEFGFGRGFSPKEYANFAVPMAESRTRVEEALAILRLSFDRRPFSFAGQHFQVDNVEVLPHCVQRPHPPLWMATVSPESFELAARLGVGVLVGPFKPWFMVKEDIARYRAAWRGHQRSGTGQVGMTLGLLCLADGKRARDHAKTNLAWFYKELLAQTAPVLKQLHAGYEYYRRLGTIAPLLSAAINLGVLETAGMVVAGDPAHCGERLGRYAEAGVDRLLLAIGAGGSPSAVVQECLHTLHAEVLPHFTRAHAHTADRR